MLHALQPEHRIHERAAPIAHTFEIVVSDPERRTAILEGHDLGTEGAGNVLSLLTWFTFGAVVVGKGFQHVSWEVITYALLSLTIIRILPVFLCLFGVKARLDTKLFVGWFGPRGLASIVFIVMVLQEKLPGNETLAAVVVWTVALSIIAHGISAVPLAKMYGQRVAARNGEV